MFKNLIAGAVVAMGAMAAMAVIAPSQAADPVRIVGSSTVYPFTTVVAERFGRTTDYPAPIVESTGTGGGFKLFCSGAGMDTPSVSNASRAIKSSEVELCAKNGVNNVIEVKVGYDGIVIANSVNGPDVSLTTKEIFLALADEVPGADGKMMKNPNMTWQDVNPSLPAEKIEVLGPPPTSGTRDAFLELAMESGCDSFDSIKALKKSDKKVHKQICHSIREDGAYVDAGENDNLIVQRLSANPDALGIFGFSFLEENASIVKAASVNGEVPTFEGIADGSYPVSRPLFFYVKQEHLGKVAGLKEFVEEFTSDAASGEDGYLADRGLIPMADDERLPLRDKILSYLSS